MSRTYGEAERERRGVDGERLKARAEAIAHRCVPSFSVSAARVGQLPALAKLYVEARQYSRADEAMSRYLRSPRVSARGKAGTLLRGINSALYSYSLYTAADPKRASHAETYLKRLESLGPAFTRQQFDAHARLAKHYLSAGARAEALRHQAKAARLSARLRTDERVSALADTFIGLLMLADLKCNSEGPGRALALLQDVSPELTRLVGGERSVAAARSRYKLGGKPAPELEPLYVLNDAAGAAAVEARGHVTVLLFAAHWCGPCRDVYPRAAEVYEKFRGEGVRVLLVTKLYGYFGGRSGLKPEEELSALRDFYVGEIKLPFPVLVEAQPAQGRAGAGESTNGAAATRDSTLFGSFPLILVIDKSGRTRAVLLGALFDQGERLRAKVEELLKES